MQRTFLRCAALWIMGLSCTARADPVVQGLVVATLGVTIVGQALGKAPSHEDRASLLVEGGRFDVVPNASNRTAANQLELEYRPGHYLVWKLKPLIGFGGTATSSSYGYTGLRLDTFWGPRVVIAPSFALAGYARGRGKDLGRPPLLGRSGIDLQYGVSDDVRVGVSLHHMSNGKLLGQERNPGTAVAGITLAVAL
jgi:hypothetical protein